MAQARAIEPVTMPVARVRIVAPDALSVTAIDALRARGLLATTAQASDLAEPREDELIAYAVTTLPTAAAAVELGTTCARAAATGRPLCVLAPAPEPPSRGAKATRAAVERAAALAYLRANGAALAHDVDAWLEAIVLIAKHGLPRGSRTAIVAPSGSWLEAQAQALVAEAAQLDMRAPLLGSLGFPGSISDGDTTDVVLYDPAAGTPPASVTQRAIAIPVAARGELSTDPAQLHGARSAFAAVGLLGRAAERMAVGLGAAPATATAELGIDRDLFERQLARIKKLFGGPRIQDHETKVLLRSYDVKITKQMVAQTPSEAVKKARMIGYPVELKPWGPDVPSEAAGCPVEKASSDAIVRSAFSSVLAAAHMGTEPGKEGSVVVRETPPSGREVSVSIFELPSLGWTVVLDAPGVGQIAAPAPLRLLDAEALAAHVVSSRAGDALPDRAGLANLLRRASHLAVDMAESITRLDLFRVIVGSRGTATLVVDAALELR